MGKDAVTLHVKKVRRGAGGVEYQYRELRWFDDRGKRRSETLGRVEDVGVREARKARDLKQAELERRPRRRGGSPRLKEWVDLVIAQRTVAGASPKTVKQYRLVQRLLEAGLGGETELLQIDPLAARRWWTQLLAGEFDGLSRRHVNQVARQVERDGRLRRTSTAQSHLRTVLAIFNQAVADQVLEANPFRRVASTQAPPDRGWRKVGPEEFELLYAVAGRWRRVLALARWAALSRMDIVGLTWDQVDLVKLELGLRRGKTDVVQRVPIGERLRELLEQWSWQRSAAKIRDDRVVEPLPYMGNLGRDVAVLCGKAGITLYGKPLHTLRKSCIDDWAAAHPPQVVQVWAGHADIQTTLKFYTTVGDEAMARGKASERDATRDATPLLWEQEAAG